MEIIINKNRLLTNTIYCNIVTMGFIPKLIARPEYGTVYQHQGMLLQNLHCRYLYIRLPQLKDLD